MQNFINTVFGPLDDRFCDYFFILSVLGFVMLVVLLLSSLLVGLTKGKGLDYYMQVLFVALGYLIFYFQNRLLYTMCAASLK